jgi:hypothetical protein
MIYLNYIFYSLLFIVSFAVAGQGILNQNEYVKQFVFGIAFVIMVIISMIQSIKNRKNVLHITRSDILVIGLLIFYLCFYIGTHNDLDFTLPVFYFLLYCFIRMQDANNLSNTIRILSQIAPAVILLHILFCALQFVKFIPAFHSYFTVGSSFGNPDMLGAYIAMLLPFCYIKPAQKIFGFTVLFLSTVLLLLLQARTALVATILTGILYLLQSGKITVKQLAKWLTLPFILVLGLLIWWHPQSFGGRLFIWTTSLNMMIKRPMGWGLYAFEKHYPEFQADYIAGHNISDIFNPDVVHSPYNEFLNIGVTLGAGGLLLFILLIVSIFIIAYKIRTPLLFPLCSFLIVSVSYFPFKIVPLSIICITFVALIINFGQATPLFSINIRQKIWLLAPIMATITLLTWNNWNNYHKWQMAVENMQREELRHTSQSQFHDIYPAMKGNGRFLITMSMLQCRMGDTLSSLSLMKEAESFFCDNVLLKNLALLYENNGQIAEAKQSFNKAVNMVPGEFNIAYERILFLQRTGEHEEAYNEALKLYHKPVKSRYYADPFIIKSKLRTLIQSY